MQRIRVYESKWLSAGIGDLVERDTLPPVL